jgi:hypothetical protein
MTTKVYQTETIKLIDGTELELSPLKLKYLRQFMDTFKNTRFAKTEDDLVDYLMDCVAVAMKQFYPAIKTAEDVADNLDLSTMYRILDITAGIKLGSEVEQSPIVDSTVSAKEEKASWDTMDLAKLEAEVFVLGIWKNYEELETSISLPELLLTIESRRELDYSEKKFLAAMQGIDLDEETGAKEKEVDPWEAMKARVASGGATSDPNDIVSFQGIRAAQAGFGIGMGLEYSTEL